VRRGAIPYRLPRPEPRRAGDDTNRRLFQPFLARGVCRLLAQTLLVKGQTRVLSNRKALTKLHAKESLRMLWTILVILLVLWLLGLVSGYTIGGFVHLLLVLALVIFIINLLTGRRSV
jgi:hypothetical protein